MKKYKHKKRGTTYRIIAEGVMSVSADWYYWNGPAYTNVDGEPVIIYQSCEDARVWVRPRDEFFDGRFEEVE